MTKAWVELAAVALFPAPRTGSELYWPFVPGRWSRWSQAGGIINFSIRRFHVLRAGRGLRYGAVSRMG